jgi:hypothetical protein
VRWRSKRSALMVVQTGNQTLSPKCTDRSAVKLCDYTQSYLLLMPWQFPAAVLASWGERKGQGGSCPFAPAVKSTRMLCARIYLSLLKIVNRCDWRPSLTFRSLCQRERLRPSRHVPTRALHKCRTIVASTHVDDATIMDCSVPQTIDTSGAEGCDTRVNQCTCRVGKVTSGPISSHAQTSIETTDPSERIVSYIAATLRYKDMATGCLATRGKRVGPGVTAEAKRNCDPLPP